MRGQRAFCDVRVFNPLAKCHHTKPLAKIHEVHEKEKNVKYATRVIEIEHGTFTPLVFSCFGGMNSECLYFYKRLAEKIAEKRNISTSEATCFIRTKISFSLIKSLVLCIRGSRSVRSDADSLADTDIVFSNQISAIKLDQLLVQQFLSYMPFDTNRHSFTLFIHRFKLFVRYFENASNRKYNDYINIIVYLKKLPR